jgi:hypothetical protein
MGVLGPGAPAEYVPLKGEEGPSILAMLCPAVATMHIVLRQAAADVRLPDSTPRRLRVWLYTSPPSMPHNCTAPPSTSVRLVGWLAACLVDYS